MKAAQINAYGGKDVLEVTQQAPKPTANAGQVIVEVMAAGVNPFDWKVREGYTKDYIPLTFPAILGGDVSGLVVEIGAGVQGFEVGQPVLGMAGAASGHGSYAEFAPVSADQLVTKPNTIDFQTAAALPLAGVSAYQAIVDHIGLQPNQKILIHGGAGGIGSLAIQIAKHIGAVVATTVSEEDVEYVTDLGADTVIDYKQQDFTQIIHDYDAVFDVVGGDTARKSYGVLKSGGVLVSMVEQNDSGLAEQHNVTFISQFTKATPERLTTIVDLAAAGALKVNIDRVFTLEQAADALEYLKVGHPRGKVVLHIKNTDM